MTLGSHQTTIGKSDSHFTPRWILDPLGPFETDAAAGDPRPWDIGTKRNVTERENCLLMDWSGFGRTWLNPPFSRNALGFITRACGHGHGIVLIHVRTDTRWYRPLWRHASAKLFLHGRVNFCTVRGDPMIITDPNAKSFGKPSNSGAPIVLCALGEADAEVLATCGLDGSFIRLPRQSETSLFPDQWVAV
jgi:hypothetical protein